MNKKDENIDNIIGSLLDENSAKDFKLHQEFAKGLFSASSTPEPDDAIIQDIKKQMAFETSKRHHSLIIRYAAAAAIILAVSIAAVLYFNTATVQTSNTALLTAKQWESTNLEIDDTDFFEISLAINDISSNLEDVEQNGFTDLSASINDLESDFENYNDQLWKG